MSKAQGETDFDFSGLFELLNLMKRKFWTYDRNQERYKRERSRLNNMYFQKLNPRGEQSAISKKIEKALQDVVDKKRKAESSTTKQLATQRNQVPGFDNVISEEINDAELNEILGTTGELDVNAMQKVLHNKLISSALDEMRKKPPKLADEEIADPRVRSKSHAKRRGILTAGRDTAQAESRSSLGLTAAQRRPSSLHGKGFRTQKIEKAQKEKVPSDWFKAYIKQADKDDEKEATDQYIEKMKVLEKKTELFFSPEVNKIRYDEYQKYLEDEMLREKIAMTLLDKHEHLKKSSIREISKYIKLADKDLFLKLKDGLYTMDQIKARIAERKNGIKYTILDDLKDVLDPDFFKEPHKGYSKNMAVHMARWQALGRDLPQQQHFFYTGRDGGQKSRDYAYLPESLGAVDFNPQFTIPKFEKPLPLQRQDMKDKVKKVQSIEDIKKEKEDVERNKKIKNIDKLKDTLAQQLLVHRQIELSQMPFDSSKQEFHDKMEILNRMNQKRSRSTNMDKRSIKSSKKQSSKPADSKLNEYLAVFEQRKIEQKERRFKLLFLKKLEMEGAKVLMSQQDRELLKNYGQTGTEDEDKLLDKAMESDFDDNLSKSERKRLGGLKQKKEEAEDGRMGGRMRNLLDSCAKTKAVTNFAQKYQKKKKKQQEQTVKYEKLFDTSRGGQIFLMTQTNELDQLISEEFIDKLFSPTQTNKNLFTANTEAHGSVSYQSSPKNVLKEQMTRSVSSPNINNYKVTDRDVDMFAAKSQTSGKFLFSGDGEGTIELRYMNNFELPPDKIQKYQTQQDGKDSERQVLAAEQRQGVQRYIIETQNKNDQDQDQEIEDEGHQSRMKPKKINELIMDNKKMTNQKNTEDSTGSPQKLSALYIDSPFDKSREINQTAEEQLKTAGFANNERTKTQILPASQIRSPTQDFTFENVGSKLQEARNLTGLNQQSMRQSHQNEHRINSAQQQAQQLADAPEFQIDKMNMLQNQKSQAAFQKSQQSMGGINQGYSVRASHRNFEDQRLSDEVKSFVNQFGIPVKEKQRSIIKQEDNRIEGQDVTHPSFRMDSAGSKSIGSGPKLNVNYKTQPVLQIHQSPTSKSIQRKLVQKPNADQFSMNNYMKPDTMKSSHCTVSATVTQEGGRMFSMASKNMTLQSGSHKPNKRMIQSQYTKRRAVRNTYNEINIQQNTYNHQPEGSQFTSKLNDDAHSEMIGSLSLVQKSPTSKGAKSFTQQRLKTALQMSKQRKLNFNRQIRQKNSSNIHNHGGGRFNNNIHISTLQQSEEAKEDLKSIQLDSLHFDIFKNQCKIYDDYKSMAAIARIQKKNKDDAIEKLQNKLLYDQQQKMRNQTSYIQDGMIQSRGAAGHSNLLMSGTQTLGPNAQTIWRNQSIKDIDTTAYPIEQIFLTSSNNKSQIAVGKRASSGYANRTIAPYSISKRMNNAEQRRNLMQQMTMSTTHKLKENFVGKLSSSNEIGFDPQIPQILTAKQVSTGGTHKFINQAQGSNMSVAQAAPNAENLQLNHKLRGQALEYQKQTSVGNTDEGSPLKVTDKDGDQVDDSNLSPLTPHAIYDNRKSSPGMEGKRPMNFSQNSDLQQVAHTSTMKNQREQPMAQTEMDKLLLNNQV